MQIGKTKPKAEYSDVPGHFWIRREGGCKYREPSSLLERAKQNFADQLFIACLPKRWAFWELLELVVPELCPALEPWGGKKKKKLVPSLDPNPALVSEASGSVRASLPDSSVQQSGRTTGYALGVLSWESSSAQVYDLHIPLATTSAGL